MDIGLDDELRVTDTTGIPTCSDYDEDCPEVVCKVTCWLYDPQRGLCPYLRTGDL